MDWIVKVLAIALALGPAIAGAAGDFPEKLIRLIVPFAPGGGTDPLSRLIAAKLSELWGQQVIVDFRPGAQGNIGTAMGANAAPDGYTITFAVAGTFVINPHIFATPGFNPIRDFAAISRGTQEAWVLVVHPSLPVKTMKELAVFARQNPGKLNFAAGASGPQLAGELFKLTTGTNIVYVPYKGAGPAAIDLIAGNVSIMFSNPTTVVPYVKSGRLRALAVLGNKRNQALTNVPTAVEAGYPEFNIESWYGIVAPAATPRNVILKLNAGVVHALNSRDVLDRLHALGQIASPSTPEEFEAQIRADLERWGKIVKATGMKVE